MKNEHQFFIDIANKVAEQSTCCRLKVGCVLVREGRIISIGYNGVPKGMKHCEDKFPEEFRKDYEHFRNVHHEWSNTHELHAEANAILFAAKEGISTKGATLYITFSPCINCAKIIASAGIKKVIYNEKYDRSSDGIDFLHELGIICGSLDDVELFDTLEENEKELINNENKTVIYPPKLYMIDKDGKRTYLKDTPHIMQKLTEEP
jgi:dCMP deaminase